jgi:DNA-binding CsgD family transcriptional regulator
MHSFIAESSDLSYIEPPEYTLPLIDETASTFGLVDLAEIWRRLVNGTYVFRTALCSDTRCFATFDAREDQPPIRPKRVHVQMLEQILNGNSQKQIALQRGCAVSSVCGSASACLKTFGWQQRPSRMPVLFVMAYHAFRQYGGEQVRLGPIEGAGPQRWVVSAARPDNSLEELLAPAELGVARLVVEGRSHAEIAALRRTSLRTVANQLASVFEKLEVSGRMQFLAKIVRREFERPK